MNRKCDICERDFAFFWTERRGIGQCTTCGNPYRMLHYDEERKRVEKEPELLVKTEHVDLLRRYWKETQRPVPSGYSFRYGYEYELATKEDAEAIDAWMEENAPVDQTP